MRVLLDTNVWNYIVNADALESIRQATRKSRHQILVAPSVLYEAARTGDPQLRSALLSAICLPDWKRMMPEAYSEAEELKLEIRRLRPSWIKRKPNLTIFKRVRYDWRRARGGAWDRVVGEEQLIRDSGAATLARARDLARERRKDAMEWLDSQKWQDLPLNDHRVAWPGWTGEPVEPWRVAGLSAFLDSLNTRGHPIFDWIGGEIDFASILAQPSSLENFWLREVERGRMPRCWVRWATETLQQHHKVSDGTPCDAQLGTYLIDADRFLSADKVFVNIANRCRAESPVDMALAELIPGGEAAVRAVLLRLNQSVF